MKWLIERTEHPNGASPYYQDAARRAERKRREAILRAELAYEGEMVDIRRLENRKARESYRPAPLVEGEQG